MVYQPEVFLAAKAVHIKFFNLIIQLKPKLRECDSQCFLEALNKLTASSKAATQQKTIPLFSPTYLEDLNNNSSEEILSRLSFLWTWNDHSILRALLEACNCQDGIKMLDEFERQIDTNQPMELFPIPPPSVKMAPSLSSAYTVLSIRCDYDRNELASLQYVNGVAEIMIEKFDFSQHSLQLLATRANPLMLYWMIPKCVVPLVSKGVKEHLDFLKEKGFSEIAIYPNTILFAVDNLTHGSFALLSSKPRVRCLCIQYAYIHTQMRKNTCTYEDTVTYVYMITIRCLHTCTVTYTYTQHTHIHTHMHMHKYTYANNIQLHL